MIKDMDEDYMGLALELAENGRGTTSPNPMVGAVVVKADQIVGRGYHVAAGCAHAEINAIIDAGENTQGATLYVTLEPCNHSGRTPPCTEEIIAAGFRRVVVAMRDPNPHVKGDGIEHLRSHGIKVACGVGEARAKRLNEAFIKFIRTGQPFVIVKCAATLDGWIATRTGDSKWVTGEKARAYVHQLRHAVDAIMVGIGTVRADDPSLTTRLENEEGHDPARIVIDPMLSIDEKARLLHIPSDAETILVTGQTIDVAKADRMKKLGVRVMRMPLENGSFDFTQLMTAFGAKDITSLLIEGGGNLIGSAIQAGVVDKTLFFFAPKILGGDDGVPICRGVGPAAMKDCLDLNSIQTRQFDDDVLIEGYIRN